MNNERLGALNFKRKVLEARERIQGDILRTPLERSGPLSRLADAEVFVKWECHQVTGSFKIRGALNKLRTLTAEQRSRGVVTASTGNHGLAVAHACRLEGTAAEIFAPASTAAEKLARLRGEDVVLHLVDASCDKVEQQARQAGLDSGRIFISPYNDLEVIFGQGTLGLEVWEDFSEAEDVLVPVGGGGLAAGIAGILKSLSPEVRIFGVEPEHSRFMAASLEAGRILDIEEKESAADAVAGGIEPGSVTFPLCQRNLDRVLTVGEVVLLRALREQHQAHPRMVEPAGALPLAAVLQYGKLFKRRNVVLVASGGNVGPERLRRLIAGYCPPGLF